MLEKPNPRRTKIDWAQLPVETGSEQYPTAREFASEKGNGAHLTAGPRN